MGPELPTERDEPQTAASSSGTAGSSKCIGVECLLIGLLGLLKNQTGERIISLLMEHHHEAEIFTYRSGDGEAALL